MRAPLIRTVDQLPAPPQRFFQALSEADEFVKELDTVRELQTRVDELTAERDEWRQKALAYRQGGDA